MRISNRSTSTPPGDVLLYERAENYFAAMLKAKCLSYRKYRQACRGEIALGKCALPPLALIL